MCYDIYMENSTKYGANIVNGNLWYSTMVGNSVMSDKNYSKRQKIGFKNTYIRVSW
mgnify:FL=1